MKFSRQEYQSELPFLPPGDLPNPEIEPESTVSPVFQGDSLLTEPLGKLTFSVEPRALLCRGSNRVEKWHGQPKQAINQFNYQFPHLG